MVQLISVERLSSLCLLPLLIHREVCLLIQGGGRRWDEPRAGLLLLFVELLSLLTPLETCCLLNFFQCKGIVNKNKVPLRSQTVTAAGSTQFEGAVAESPRLTKSCLLILRNSKGDLLPSRSSL